jgi:hypothetical protein
VDGVGINDNGLGSDGDLPALAVKAEKITPFRSGMRGHGDLIGTSAVTAATAAVQQNLARMEKVRDRQPSTDILLVPDSSSPEVSQTEIQSRKHFFFFF